MFRTSWYLNKIPLSLRQLVLVDCSQVWGLLLKGARGIVTRHCAQHDLVSRIQIYTQSSILLRILLYSFCHEFLPYSFVFYLSFLRLQSIGDCPKSSSALFTFEKHLDPIKASVPRQADNGLGWLDATTRCLDLSTFLPTTFAEFPQSRKTNPLFLRFNASIRLEVICSQPFNL